MKQTLIVLILIQFINFNIAQDVQFSQLFGDRMYLNPAYAGTDYCPKLTLSYRNQWPGIRFPYETYSATFDKYAPILSGGIGVRLMNDKQGRGTFNHFNADFIYSYYTNLSRKIKAKFAFQASFYQKSMNTNDLIFHNMIDPVQGVIYPHAENISNENFISPDFSAGILLNFDKFHFGFSANHIPHTIVERHKDYLPLKYTAHVGALLVLDKNDKKQTKYILEPNVVFIKQLNLSMLYYGMYFDIKNTAFGMFYRQNLEFHFDAVALSFHQNIKSLTISYSYDFTLSGFLGQTLGSHELSLAYIFSCDKKIRNYNTISCPSF